MTVRLAGAGPAGRFAAAHNHDINVTPFVDVMLVLLIVFIIAAPIATTALRLDLPRGGGAVTPGNRALVSIDAEGGIYVSTASRLDAPVDLNHLASSLAPLGPAGAAHISVRADQRVRYGRFVSVLNRLQDNGYDKVDLVVVPAEQR